MQEWLQRRQTIRVVGLGAILIIAAFVQSCSELKYRLWAVRGEAEVTEIQPTEYPDRTLVKFWLRDADGRWARFSRRLSISEHPLQVGSKVEVEFIPRQAEKARLIEERSLLWPFILLGLIAVGVGWVVWVWRDFHKNMR